MTEPLGAGAILEQLRAMGLSDIKMSRDLIGHGWRIRGDGGLILQIYDSGKPADTIRASGCYTPRTKAEDMTATRQTARRTASLVRALPWRNWPIAHPSIRWKRLHHQTPGSNI